MDEKSTSVGSMPISRIRFIGIEHSGGTRCTHRMPWLKSRRRAGSASGLVQSSSHRPAHRIAEVLVWRETPSTSAQRRRLAVVVLCRSSRDAIVDRPGMVFFVVVQNRALKKISAVLVSGMASMRPKVMP